MLASRYFLPTLKEKPVEANIVSHQLMLRAGMIRQVTSGIYNWLPLGLSVLQKVEQIIREEMNKAHSFEILMPLMQPTDLWKKSGRYRDGGEMSKESLMVRDKHDNELVFSPTAEEVVTELFGNNVQSYKDLPKILYQVHWKFRDEIRPRYGVLRCREFLMKDAYSFDLTEKQALSSYNKMLKAYLRIYGRMGLTAIPVVASSGDMGGNYTHELHILANTGESTVYYDSEIVGALKNEDFDLAMLGTFYAREEEKHDLIACQVPESRLRVSKGIEVGQLFYLGNRYTKILNVKIQMDDGTYIFPEMGCYGIGVSRLVGAIIESSHDDLGIIWPKAVTPFQCGIVNLKSGDALCDAVSMRIYEHLINADISVLYDDTHESAGVKFSKMDLIGLPLQIIIGPKKAINSVVEIKIRQTNSMVECSIEETANYCRNFYSDICRY
ncbi:Proline--tRNA ligase [Alphaproteobacteria bacterium]